VQADLHSLIREPAIAAAVARCRPLYVPNHRPVPDLAYWTDTRAGDVRALTVDPSPDGVYVGPATVSSAELSVLDPRDPKPLGAQVPPPGRGPAGWGREIGRNRSWVAFSAGCSG
jgi:hypothetical protein